MKKILFATGNPTKAKRFSLGLKKYDIEVLSLKDLNISLDVLENGVDVVDNALSILIALPLIAPNRTSNATAVLNVISKFIIAFRLI